MLSFTVYLCKVSGDLHMDMSVSLSNSPLCVEVGCTRGDVSNECVGEIEAAVAFRRTSETESWS